MNKNRLNYITVKWIISLICSVWIGTFAMNILNNIGVNVWIARIAGAIVCVIIGLLFYYLWIKKIEKSAKL